jgi:hypothetical protein
MNFSDALVHLKLGKQMRCKFWPKQKFRVYLDDDNLFYVSEETSHHALDGFDLTADDWEEYQPQGIT